MSVELNRDVIDALKRVYDEALRKAQEAKEPKEPPKTKPGSSAGSISPSGKSGAANKTKTSANNIFTAQITNEGPGDTVELASAKGAEPQQPETKQTAAKMSDDAVELSTEVEKLTQNDKTVSQLMKGFKQQGEEFHVAAKKAAKTDEEQVSRVADLYAQKFKENPELRKEMQKHFNELKPNEQKALILDFERRAMNGEDISSEVDSLLNALKDADVEVKSFAHLRMRKHCSDEQVKKFDNKIGYALTYEEAKNKYESAVIQYRLANSGDKQDGQIAIKRLENECPECQKGNAEILANSECAKEHQEFRTQYNECLHKLAPEAQAEAAKAALDSKYFTEDDRNDTISQFKKFKTPEAQRKAAQYADECELMTTRNRKFLVSQIKLLHQSIQASVMQRMMQNQMNTKNKEVMNAITNEVPNLKIDDKAKNDILTALKNSGKVPEATIKQVEKILTEQAAAHKNINSAGSDKYSAQVKAQVELQSRLYAATGNNELSHLIASGTLSSKSQSLTQFVDLLDRRTITPELVIAAGHKNVLKSNFIALTKDSQEKVFDMLTADEVSEMWDKGQIPKRFEDKVMAKLANNMTTTVASKLAQTGSFTELVNFSQQAIAQKHKNIFTEALTKRYSNRLPDLQNGRLA